jgi:hypothetical protein
MDDIYPTFAEAEHYVLGGDDILLQKGYVRGYLLIEKVPKGCPTITRERHWYRVIMTPDPERDYFCQVLPCDTPNWVRHGANNFSMG